MVDGARWRFHGVPVHFDRRVRVAEARGIWPFKRIVVGPLWCSLPTRMRDAVLMHELKHCLAFHLEKRLLLLPLFWTKWAARIAEKQELEADAFAAAHGYGVDLLKFVVRYGASDRDFYPCFDERVEHLNKLITGSVHEMVA